MRVLQHNIIMQYSIEFYECAINNRLWDCTESTLIAISQNKHMFPANMRQRATYWVNQKEGKHNHLPTQKQRDARKINWALRQLEGIKSQLGQVYQHTASKSAGLEASLFRAQREVGFAIAEIRALNYNKTGKPPKSVREELVLWKQYDGYPMPDRLAMYDTLEKHNE